MIFFIAFVLLNVRLLNAQSPTAKIYLTSGNGFDLVTTFDTEKPIRLRLCCPILLEISTDTLGLIINRKPVAVPVERGKSYYFIMSTSQGIREASVLQFWLMLGMSAQRKMSHFLLSKEAGVVEVSEE